MSHRHGVRQARAAAAFLAVCLATGSAVAQEGSPPGPLPVPPHLVELQRRVHEQWRVIPLQEGLLLVPRQPGRSFSGVELRSGTIAVDGEALTEAGLRARVGADVDTVVALSSLNSEDLRAVADPRPRRATARPEVEPPAPAVEGPPSADRTYTKRHNARVRVGADLVIEENERVDDAAVAVLGSVIVHGMVRGDVVAVGGDVRLGPTATVGGDVTAVGGTIVADGSARIVGHANEVAIRLPRFDIRLPPWPRTDVGPWPTERWLAGFAFTWTVVRMTAIATLGLLLATLAPGPLSRVRAQVLEAPLASAVTGLAGELLLAPALLVLAFLLLISVLGIPLIALMPLLVTAVGVAWIAGFVAVAQVVGSVVPGLRGRPVPSLLAGLLAIWITALLARSLWWSDAAGWTLPAVLGTAGFALELVAWTVGLGAVLLAWLRRDGNFRARAPARTAVPPIPPAPLHL